MTGALAFDLALSLNKISDINFGNVKAGTASTYRISTAGAVSVVSGSGAFFSGTTSAGNINISGSATQTIGISAGGLVANNGVTPANPTCAYNGGPSGSCTITGAVAPGTGKTLLVGVDAVADGTQADGATATPSFTITVVYQ